MIEIDNTWTLFLDRDGVINRRKVGDYIKTPKEFVFLPGVLDAIAEFNHFFYKIIVVTNQQGIGKELMTHNDLDLVHQEMLEVIQKTDGRIDAIYYCPHLAHEDPLCRKPNPGMALEAKKDFPNISFEKSIMVGDSESDIVFGNKVGMKTVYISEQKLDLADLTLSSLKELTLKLKNNKI